MLPLIQLNIADDEYRQAAEALSEITDDIESGLENGFEQRMEHDEAKNGDIEMNNRRRSRASLSRSHYDAEAQHKTMVPSFYNNNATSKNGSTKSNANSSPGAAADNEPFNVLGGQRDSTRSGRSASAALSDGTGAGQEEDMQR